MAQIIETLYMKSFSVVTLTVIFLVSFVGSLKANEQYAVRGTLYDFESFDPIYSAEITVLGTSMKVVSDKEGLYEIEGLPSGKYDIQYYANGYQRKIIKEIYLEHDVTFNIALEKQAQTKPQEVEIKLDLAYFKKIEYPLKSSFVYKLATYVRWQNLNNSKTFRIGIIGQLPQHGKIEIPKDKTIAGLPVEIVNISDIETAKHCKVLFFTKADSKLVQEITDELTGLEILTIGDTETTKSKNMMVNLLTLETNLSYMIQQKNINNTPLKYDENLFKKASYINKK